MENLMETQTTTVSGKLIWQPLLAGMMLDVHIVTMAMVMVNSTLFVRQQNNL